MTANVSAVIAQPGGDGLDDGLTAGDRAAGPSKVRETEQGVAADVLVGVPRQGKADVLRPLRPAGRGFEADADRDITNLACISAVEHRLGIGSRPTVDEGIHVP